jgi:Flp pilus assembly protein TadG
LKFPHFLFPRERRDTRHSGESGQALIETAISLAMLVIMLLGAVEVGRIAWASIQVVNAAKAAVQYGDISNRNSSDMVGMQNAAAASATALPNLQTNVTSTCVCADGTACLTPSASIHNRCPGGAAVGTLHVTSQVTFNPAIHLPGMPATYTLYGRAVQQVLSNGF